MKVREIPLSGWPEFLDAFSRSHRAWLATVDRTGLPGPLMDAGEHALHSVTPEQRDGRIQSIAILFREDAPAGKEPLRVHAPTRVRVEETDEGTTRALEIEDADGGSTRIRFRAAPLPEMLDGIAPGELSP